MIYRKFINLVEDHSELLTQNWIHIIRNNPCTAGYKSLPYDILHGRIFDVYNRLGDWISDDEDNFSKTARHFMMLGRERHHEGLKSSEVIFALHAARENVWRYVMDSGIINNTLEIHQALEFYERIVVFFDKACYYVALGYESIHLSDEEAFKKGGFFDKTVNSLFKWLIPAEH
ncbi:MAG: hypothetical protein GXX85_12835 [Ignavibacteria bacterium]|nr:hypothetical protein [Ignavibacteria bacterium]